MKTTKLVKYILGIIALALTIVLALGETGGNSTAIAVVIIISLLFIVASVGYFQKKQKE